MSPRVYNIVFHTHTISGIIISALLYVIFFTGTLSFLRDEINAWERNEPIAEGYFERIDFDRTLKQLEAETQLYSRDREGGGVTFSISIPKNSPREITPGIIRWENCFTACIFSRR